MSAKEVRRTRMLIALALMILMLYGLFAVLDARRAEARLEQARRDLDETVTKLNDIKRLQQAPRVAALRLEPPAEITNRIAAARLAAGLPQSRLLKEEPADPQRIQRTDFEIRSTSIELAPSTLPEIVRFCDSLRDEQTGSVVRDIRLSEPRNQANRGDQERWEAGLTLTQMIFSPKSR